MSAKQLGEQLPVINSNLHNMKNKTKENSPANVTDNIMETANKPGQRFVYEVVSKSGEPSQRLECKGQCACNGTLFIFPLLDNTELLLVVANVISVRLIEEPKGTSTIIGLDGKPADAPKSVVKLS